MCANRNQKQIQNQLLCSTLYNQHETNTCKLINDNPYMTQLSTTTTNNHQLQQQQPNNTPTKNRSRIKQTRYKMYKN